MKERFLNFLESVKDEIINILNNNNLYFFYKFYFIIQIILFFMILYNLRINTT